MNATTSRLSDPDSSNATAILCAVTLDGASAGRICSGCLAAISPSDGKDSGSATASAIHTAITAHGRRTTTSASRRISAAPPPCTAAIAGLRWDGQTLRRFSRYATRPQLPVSATSAATDLMARIYRSTDFFATGLSGCMIAISTPWSYRKM